MASSKNLNSRLRGICAALFLSVCATAQAADEAAIKAAVEAFVGGNGRVESLRKAPIPGLYEVALFSERAGRDILYVDEKVSFVFSGDLYDVRTRKSLTQTRVDELSAIKFADLPLDAAIKTVRGSGKRVLATFEDPNCGYCKKLAQDLQALKDVTIYTFMVPILGPDSDVKARAIWCSADRSKAWNDWMISGVRPNGAGCDSSGVDKARALGARINVRGTPTIMLADGTRIGGYVPADQLEMRIAQAAK
ncbi:MAG: DsbC family protein [Rhodocyclaceae bacterium]|nr:DsbC family protein [Rhodocyclaceae bacterium]